MWLLILAIFALNLFETNSLLLTAHLIVPLFVKEGIGEISASLQFQRKFSLMALRILIDTYYEFRSNKIPLNTA